ncbi:response regulator [Leptolyngbya ohadii]|uniref:response regulator n=1 Tax=Leptolyngbya ohadii TaxID=1962290 RepID=UPI000B5A05D7|nr:response regulator [Leptolyngbya ohadii]
MSAKQILLIDDENRLARIVDVCLRRLGGWSVSIAGSGTEGLLHAETKRPDAILLDVMLPDTDGLHLLQQLRANPNTRSIPVILLTAKIDAVTPTQIQAFDIAGVIYKPFDPYKLADQVAEMLGWQI